MKSISEEQEIAFAKEFCTLNECSPNVVVLSAPDSADAENFKILRAQILFGKRRHRPRTIMVTSTYPGEGKTFVTVNLAVSLALGIDEHVLLMDCDLRRPQVHETLGYRNGEGLHECLTGKKPLEEVITRTEIDKLYLLTAGKLPENPTELLSSTTMRSFLQEMKQRYKDRLVVIDSAPSHITAEAKVLAEYVDGIIFVIMAGKAQRKDIHRAIQNFGREKILGIVLNGYSQANKYYKKHYKKYYKGE
jgi:exopolysaccharide/PEP-CTERM locus tyrosine autokinase